MVESGEIAGELANDAAKHMGMIGVTVPGNAEVEPWPKAVASEKKTEIESEGRCETERLSSFIDIEKGTKISYGTTSTV